MIDYMNEKFQVYIDNVIDHIGVTGKKEKRIREDLYTALIEKADATGENDPYILMGDIEEVAEEFRANLGIKDNGVYESQYINGYKYRYGYGLSYEYVSKTKIFGIPLVHINTKPFGVAKGIFSLGTLAIGVFSLGAVSLGVMSFGALGLGLLIAFGGMSISGLISLGGIAISGLMSMGGLSIAYGYSLGGLAIAKFIAVGGYAKADIAIGGVTNGIVSVFKQHGTGQYMFQTPVNSEEVITTIRTVFPRTGNGILNFIKNFL